MAATGPLIFGEVLFDCFPDGSRVLGGAPFNVAWHCQAFGLKPLFISRVGEDPMGHSVAQAMRDWKMDMSGLQFDSMHATGSVNVSFERGEPEYDIVENSAWDYIEPQLIPATEDHNILYHGTLATRRSVSASSLQTLKNNSALPVFIDINLRSPWWRLALIESTVATAKWIKLNTDELSLIAPQQSTDEARVQHLLLNSAIEFIVVTQGEAGSIAFSRNESYKIVPEKSDVVIDTVGAGDAFCSVLLLGLEKKWPLSIMLKRAQKFASAVVGQRGATTQNNKFYDNFINVWEL